MKKNKKKVKLKNWVKVVLGLIKFSAKVAIVILAVITIKNHIMEVKAYNEAKEKEVVMNYIQCLEDNFTQRDYCSKKVSDTSYIILDQKLEKYGYGYKQVGYDLYVIEIEK